MLSVQIRGHAAQRGRGVGGEGHQEGDTQAQVRETPGGRYSSTGKRDIRREILKQRSLNL